MKARRQAALLALIQEQDVETQDQILTLLKENGINATQATISRDIKELHLIKELSGAGKYRYVVSEQKLLQGVSARLRNIFKEGVTSFEVAQNIVVLRTVPGLASAACAAIDSMEIPALVGTLAGDDTGILIMRTQEEAGAFCSEIHKML